MAKKPAIKIKHKGLLHEKMGVAKGKKIPTKDISKDKSKAKKNGNTAEVKRDTFTLNARQWKK